MGVGQGVEPSLATSRESQERPAPIGGSPSSRDEPQGGQPIDEPHGTVVAEVKALGQIADREGPSVQPGPHGEERLVLPRGEPGAAGRIFAEGQELPQRSAERRQRLVLGLSQTRPPRCRQRDPPPV